MNGQPVALGDGLQYFDAAAVQSRLRPDACVAAMREALVAVSQGRVQAPPRTIAALPDGAGLALMPGALADAPWAGAKVIGRFMPAPADGAGPRRAGVFLLFDRRQGRLRAIVDAASLTNRRTAAVTVAATQALAPKGPRRIALLGTGALARAHAEAFAADPATEGLVLWGRDAARTQALAHQLHTACARPLHIAATPQDAVAWADVVCTLTGADEPIVQGAWLRPGQHLNVVGGSTAHEREVDDAAILRCRVFVDQRTQAAQAAGELLHAQAAGLIGDGHVLGEIGEVLAGRLAGRVGPQDITLFKSLGLFAEDCHAAALLLAP